MTRTNLRSTLRMTTAVAICATAVVVGEPQRGRPAPARFDVVEKSMAELQAAMTRGEVTARDLVDLYLARIAAYDQAGPEINAFIALNPKARDTAASLDAERAAGKLRGPLHGIPIVVKDNFDTADMPTTGGSIALATFQPTADAFHVVELRKAGAVVIGKTNLHELAAGIVSVSSFGGQTRNPYDPARNPGGSSGGTGAAIAANFAAAGLGSDTCGSIRIPASQNALVGLRPAKATANTRGVMPLSHSQDVAGPLARSIPDLALMLDAVAGEKPAGFVASLGGAAAGTMRIGILTALFGAAPEDQEAAEIVRGAIGRLRSAGVAVVDADIQGLDGLIQGTSLIDQDFKFDLADYLAATPTPPVRSLGEILERGLFHQALEATFRRRNAVVDRDGPARREIVAKRAALRDAVEQTMARHRLTALVYPTMKRKPALVGEPQNGSNCQLSASTGLPALSVPAGFTADGLPIGAEFLGAEDGALALLELGLTLERQMAVRRAPASTPRLTGPVTPLAPRGPASSAAQTRVLQAVFELKADETRLAYDIRVNGLQPDAVLLVALRRAGSPVENGPILTRLLRTGQLQARGELPLRESAREDLKAGRLYIQLFTRSQPLGAERVAVAIKRP